MSRSAEEINEQAALWILRSEESDWTANQQAELETWLNESFHHRAAYLRLREGWHAADRLGTFAPEPDRFHSVWANRLYRHAPYWAFAASLLTVLFGGAMLWLFFTAISAVPPVSTIHQIALEPTQTFVTQVGGRAIVPLADGSQIELNTDSAVRVRIGERQREVWLDRGEVYFEVAHRINVPFVVHSGPRMLTVLGTRFVVRRDPQKLTVAVVAGRVKIEDAGSRAGSAVLTAGNIAIARRVSTLLETNAQDKVASLLAWRDGMLKFSNTKLSDVVAEFNRYHTRQIIVVDSPTANIRIGGAFRLSEVDLFLRLLHDAYDLDVAWSPEKVKIAQP